MRCLFALVLGHVESFAATFVSPRKVRSLGYTPNEASSQRWPAEKRPPVLASTCGYFLTFHVIIHCPSTRESAVKNILCSFALLLAFDNACLFGEEGSGLQRDADVVFSHKRIWPLTMADYGLVGLWLYVQ